MQVLLCICFKPRLNYSHEQVHVVILAKGKPTLFVPKLLSAKVWSIGLQKQFGYLTILRF